MSTLTDKAFFRICYDHIMEWETPKYTNHKNDLGGPTKYGITLATLSTWRKKKCTAKDVELLQEQEAVDIYYNMFYLQNSCHLLPPAIAFCIFDGAVNQNALAMRKYLQISLRTQADGVIGPVTARLAGEKDVVTILKEFMALRALRYSGSKTVKDHGLGWFRRMFNTHQRALNLTSTKRKEN